MSKKKVAFVTGGSGGIGKSICLKLIKNYPKNNHPSILYYSALINDKLKKKND